MRRLLTATLLVVSGLALLGAAPGRAAAAGNEPGGVDVVKLDGLLDPPNVDLAERAIRDANDRGAQLVVLQLDSDGVLDEGLDGVLAAIESSEVPIATWVGPSGSSAGGGAAVLLEASHVASISNGSGAGAAYPIALDDPGRVSRAQVANLLASLAERRGRDATGARRLASKRLSATQAREAGAIDLVAPTLGELVVRLDGREIGTAAGTVELDVADVVGKGTERRLQPSVEIRFLRLDLAAQALHTVTSPSIAYFLLVAGIGLVLFEFFTAGIGLAGLAGAGALVGAFLGFSHLPVRWWAVALVFLAFAGYGIDIQAAISKAWTVIGTLCLVAGTWFLYSGGRIQVAWWAAIVVIVGALVFALAAMPAMVRSRFGTPTIGREGLIGETGLAEVDIAPDGVVQVRGALWRARTNRATPIRAGGAVRVLELDGLVLEVEPEPEAGSARGDRERPATNPEQG